MKETFLEIEFCVVGSGAEEMRLAQVGVGGAPEL